MIRGKSTKSKNLYSRQALKLKVVIAVNTRCINSSVHVLRYGISVSVFFHLQSETLNHNSLALFWHKLSMGLAIFEIVEGDPKLHLCWLEDGRSLRIFLLFVSFLFWGCKAMNSLMDSRVKGCSVVLTLLLLKRQQHLLHVSPVQALWYWYWKLQKFYY